MISNINKFSDFSDFLMDDEFILRAGSEDDKDKYINDLKKRFPKNADEIDLALKVLIEFRKQYPETGDNLRQKVWNRLLHNRMRSRMMFFIRVAASIMLVLAAGGLAYYLSYNKTHLDIEEFATTERPSFESSKIILSDGQQVQLSDYESKITYSDDGSNIKIDDSTELMQITNTENFNQLIVPYGKYTSVQLSDGTKVWVNSGSRLIYPPAFSGKIREVFVEGEAYFDVARDITKPFYIKTERFRVEVLGTRFSVQADHQEDLFSVLLIEGDVALTAAQGKFSRGKTTRLQPGERASLPANQNSFDVLLLDDPENYIGWINGYLIFNEEPLYLVLKRLARFYNINVDYSATQRNIMISGRLELKDDAERVLKGLSAIAKSSMIKKDDKYILY